MLPIFRELILKSRPREKDNLVFAGCPGPCFSMASFFSSGLRDLKLNQYFAVDSDINQLWKLEYTENLGVNATTKENPLKANVIVLMSGLCAIPIERTINFIKEALAADGVIIGEAPAPGLFEGGDWAKKMPFHFLFEFSMKRPASYKVGKI
jgi:hypothetical protein